MNKLIIRVIKSALRFSLVISYFENGSIPVEQIKNEICDEYGPGI